MPEIIDLAQKLGSVGFPTLLVLILYGSYKRVWVWGRELVEAKADAQEWKTMALQAAGLAETTVNIVKTRIPG